MAVLAGEEITSVDRAPLNVIVPLRDGEVDYGGIHIIVKGAESGEFSQRQASIIFVENLGGVFLRDDSGQLVRVRSEILIMDSGIYVCPTLFNTGTLQQYDQTSGPMIALNQNTLMIWCASESSQTLSFPRFIKIADLADYGKILWRIVSEEEGGDASVVETLKAAIQMHVSMIVARR